MHLNKLKPVTIYFMVIVLLYITYGLYFNTTYNCDLLQAYKMPFGLEYGFREFIRQRLANGRIVTVIPYLFYRLIWYLDVSYFSNQWVLQLLSFALLAAGATVIVRCIGNKYALPLMIGLISPAFVEILAFCGLEQPLAYLLTALSLFMYSKKRYIVSVIILLAAVSTYQSYAIVFAILMLGYVYIQEEKNGIKSRLVRYLIGMIITAVAAFSNILGTKTICKIIAVPEVKHTATGFSFSFLRQRTLEIWDEYGAVLRSGYAYYPRNIILVLLTTFVLVTGVTLIKNKKWVRLAEYLSIVIAMLITPVLFCYVTESVYLPQRTILSFYMAIGLILSVSLSEIEDDRIVRYGFALTGLFLLLTINRIQTGIMDYSTCNKLEFYQAEQIVRYIKSYENQTGNTIDTIKVMKVPVGTQLFEQRYLNIFSDKGSVSQHLFGTSWSDVECISFVAGKIYNREDMTEEELQKRFPGFDRTTTDTLSETEHLKAENNVLYWITIG